GSESLERGKDGSPAGAPTALPEASPRGGRVAYSHLRTRRDFGLEGAPVDHVCHPDEGQEADPLRQELPAYGEGLGQTLDAGAGEIEERCREAHDRAPRDESGAVETAGTRVRLRFAATLQIDELAGQPPEEDRRR